MASIIKFAGRRGQINSISQNPPPLIKAPTFGTVGCSSLFYWNGDDPQAHQWKIKKQ
jgi:hypothetical protein